MINGVPLTQAGVVELAKGAGLKIRSLAVQGFESPPPHHVRQVSYFPPRTSLSASSAMLAHLSASSMRDMA